MVNGCKHVVAHLKWVISDDSSASILKFSLPNPHLIYPFNPRGLLIKIKRNTRQRTLLKFDRHTNISFICRAFTREKMQRKRTNKVEQ